jgi:UDP-GlcNAc3NAcA epimerase
VAASKIDMPVAHVEAGLRSFNRRMPEEINRVLTDHVSDLLFAPTTAAVENLHREGIRPSAVHLVGDVMYDAALAFATSAEKRSTIIRDIELGDRGFVLATIHRQENTDDHARLADIFKGLATIANEVPVVVPLHPRTRSRLQQAGIVPSARQLKFLPPVGYLDMLALLQHARLVVTDSGGVQKEAFFFRVPCVTLRSETEWIELVQSGWNRLVAPESAEVVVDGIRNALNSAAPARSESDDVLYGGGKAARKIMQVLLENQRPGKRQ